ncbi:iron-containing alcohol dehydrogenase [Sporosarcina thermotolerans]|uniref:Iron-containing alcohol dehydrogenase n=1 Tax=Sporosarcina thermotolerans TaxID=633404 RepID=A0AAW9ADB8_9BACL|nr:iron-containing alcohol dehydrogenase [Sporosarcina thermotolerans]MDW0117621.1 iron-containing alcohol dehydrogenase [Sporosarcina thermotolerans]WHT49766.1 iron-containing alcohol dehydrogenase [Sporosarcina thermotolerans]
MKEFSFQNPTKLVFGKNSISKLAEELSAYGNKILVVYGGGSIKRNGLYDELMQILKDENKEVFEFAGVEPNPRLSTAKRGAEICKENDIDFILAVGGGSVIDCTKLIASAAKYDGDPWDFVTKKASPKEAIPFGTILTIAATGSEMNAGSVITNEETEEKYGWGGPLNFPKFSILDPTYTLSLPKDQTVYGIVDMMSHIFEQYFHNASNTPLQDELCEGALRAIMEAGEKLVNDLQNYELRETILLGGTWGLNGFLGMGNAGGDWGTHDIEHAISAVYDIPHAGGLAILFPHWMKQTLHLNPARYARLSVKVFGVNPEGKSDEEIAIEGIDKLRAYWTSIGAPERLADYGIDGTKIDIMAKKAAVNGPLGRYAQLSEEEVKTLLEASL